MQESVQYVINEIRGAWRFRWWAMLTVWVICLFGWAGVFMLPDHFEAESRFYVNTTTRLDEVMGGVIIDADEVTMVFAPSTVQNCCANTDTPPVPNNNTVSPA